MTREEMIALLDKIEQEVRNEYDTRHVYPMFDQLRKALSSAPPVAETPPPDDYMCPADCPGCMECDPIGAYRPPASPVVAPAPVVEKAMQYAIALMRDRLDVEAPANAAVIREYIAALSPRETAPGGGR